jgi:serine/threonine protein kinase
LGGGGFGRTYIAEDLHLPGKPTCIIKQLKPISSMQEVLDMARDLFDREAKVLYRLGRHEQIPSLMAHFEEDEEFFLAQEYIQGYTLNQEIRRGKKLSESYVMAFLGEILPVLEFVHSQQVIHRDLKPSNIMRRKADNHIVLIDFGAVKEVTTQSLQETSLTHSGLAIGSPGYMPNEQYAGRAQYASDIYAVGVTCIQALTGVSPRDLPECPETHELRWRQLAEVSDPVAELLEKMVRIDYRERYRTVPELIQDFLKMPILSRPTKTKPSPKAHEPALASPTITEEVPSAQLDTLPITQIADNLAQLGDQLRVKKLMCLICTGILENDPLRLENMLLQDLVLSIYEICPNPDQLKTQILNGVQTIAPAKQPQYLTIGKAIYGILLPLYGIPSPQEQAASALESDLQQIRVKKLLLFVCRQTWENDLNKLQSIKVADLLKELRQISPSLAKLKTLLDERVKATSKPAEYMAIADLIIEKLSLNYDPDGVSAISAAEPPEPSDSLARPLDGDLFDMRLELMRYCNPLRLKVLLFVAAGDVKGSMDWTELKVHDLDALLRSLLSVCPDLTSLQKRLQQSLAQLQPTEIYHQVHLQVVRVLKPIYGNF